ncbi:hypothetical protein FRX31_003021 [Thalictrum thalictroides]|uniref:Uncharacterized protein n=1 Tax=Thalictrum thalictroides TaxID=46969 RepID=A0A7J6XC72_THATH|nr:hypothetical protein FRX31_003021 [Thalictrum thalictroides]
MADCDWSQLLNDLLFTIGKKVNVSADRFSFRLVCKSWSCSICPFPQPPWLMLAQSETGIDSSKKEDDEEQNISTTSVLPLLVALLVLALNKSI